MQKQQLNKTSNISRLKPRNDELNNNKTVIMQNLLLDLPGITNATFINSITSSVTTKWGVNWDEEMISRDILQNFRDNNLDNIDGIEINVKKDLISVYAPKEFDLRELYFVGSNKKNDPSTIGEFGEGFKCAVVSMLKKGIDHPISISGKTACIISVGDQVDDSLDLRPLVYNFFEINDQNGCYFYVNTFNEELKNAFQFGLKNFWHENNEVVDEFLHSYNEISFYKSKERDGYIFYAGIKRGMIKNVPLVVNINKRYQAIEKKISQDRDRNSFDDRLTQSLYNIAFKSGFHYSTGADNPVVQFILNKTKKLWTSGSGHPLLKAMADNLSWIGRGEEDDDYLYLLFGDKYFSQSSYSYFNTYQYRNHSWYELQPAIALHDRKLKKKGKIEVPAYFVRFGVKSSAAIICEERDQIEEEAKNKSTKKLNMNEIHALKICLECVREIAPEFRGLFSDVIEGKYSTSEGRFYNVSYMSVTSDKLLGELQNSSSVYGDKTIYLNKKLFKDQFGRAFSTLLHEMCHIFGADGSRDFSDFLTVVMERIINSHKVIKSYTKKWDEWREASHGKK